MPHEQPPEPWRSFLLDLDNSLDQSVSLHCIGGFALAMLHDLPRPTADVDCLAVVPSGETARLQQLAGEDSALHDKYGVYLQYVGVVTVPDDYAGRLISLFPAAFQRLQLMSLEAHDLALSKLERNSARDREDIRFLARTAPLDLALLESRYRLELRPYLAHQERHDLTLRLWLEMLRGG